jgi:hypothetical protein
MAMTLSKVQDKVTTTTVLWDDESVDVGYHPAAITPALLEQVQAAAGAENLDVVGALLEPVLAWWDVLTDDGERYPTDAETIKIMPLAFTMAVLTQVQEAMRPPEPRT